MKRVLSPQSFFDDETLLQAFESNNINPKHHCVLWRFIVRSEALITSFESCPGLPKAAYSVLAENFLPFTSKVEKVVTSADNNTTKLLVRLQDGSQIETVIMIYDRKNNPSLAHKARATVCISSQVGCKMACTFCATGTMGFSAHLTAGEIVEQLVHANRIAKIKNVVFMGMGEPLDNYENVVSAVKVMVDQKRFNLGASHVCVSTVGVIPRMRQLLRDIPGISLALSLHAPTQDLRVKIVPTAKAWPLDKLLSVVEEYLRKGRVMIEYIVIGDVNDSNENAHLLGKLFMGKDVIINLIPYNPTNVKENFQPPEKERVVEFERIIQQEYKIIATIRRTMGQDIDGACGQLVVKNGGNAKADSEVKDIEDLCTTSTSTTPSSTTANETNNNGNYYWGLWNTMSSFFKGSAE